LSRAALEIAADMQTQSDQERWIARIIRSTPAIQARIRDRMGRWEEKLAAMIADERGATTDVLDSHVVAAALVGLLRPVQQVAVAAEMQLDLPALMDHAVVLRVILVTRLPSILKEPSTVRPLPITLDDESAMRERAAARERDHDG
jgi:hypothetical protein